MTIVSRLVGKFGGVEVQKIPVDIVAKGSSGSVVVMHTVHVPEGETWLVALSGNLVAGNSSSVYQPDLQIGAVIGPRIPTGIAALVAEVTGTAEIALKRNAGSGSDSLVGHVYTVPLP